MKLIRMHCIFEQNYLNDLKGKLLGNLSLKRLHNIFLWISPLTDFSCSPQNLSLCPGTTDASPSLTRKGFPPTVRLGENHKPLLV